jgi:hypothetical protein
MKILTLAFLGAIVLATAAQAEEGVYIGTVNIIYVRGSGIPTVADEIEKREKPRNRLGSGLLILGGMQPVAPVPHRKR